MTDADYDLLREEFQANCQKLDLLHQLIVKETDETKQLALLEQMKQIEPKVKQFMALTT